MHYFKLFLVLCVLVCFSLKAKIVPKAFFGKDTIIESRQASLDLIKAGESVAMMLANNAFIETDSYVDLDPMFFLKASDSTNHGLCEEVRFSQQLANPVSCTGFLVGEDLLMTAGHCMLNFGHLENESNAHCENFSWLFDHEKLNGKPVRLSKINKNNLYRCKKIVKASFGRLDKPIRGREYDHDFALIQLDRKVTGRSFLKISKRKVRVGELLDIVGHPLGLPKKVATNGRVNVNSHPYYFEVAIDSFSGNSGSPLLNKNGQVVGILVRGPEEAIYDDQKQCYRLNKCNRFGKGCEVKDASITYQNGMHGQRINGFLSLP